MNQLIVGIGNPQEKYVETYHNVGRWCVDSLAGGDTFETKKTAKCEMVAKGEVILAKSLIPMNLSGQAVKQAMAYTNIGPEAVTVIHDDTDLALGTYKVQTGRGSGGHHGVDSVFQHLGTKNIRRVRLGVRPGRWQTKEANDFVLKKVKAEDREMIYTMFEEVRDILDIPE